MRKITKRSIYAACFLVILFMCIQLLIYKEYAFESMWLYAREGLNISTISDHKKHGAICYSLGRLNCSIHFFTKLLREDPGNIDALSSLAMALTMSKKEEKAFPYYRAYFSSGGRAFDVMYWYAQALKNVGQIQGAIPWLYNVVYYKPDDIDAARELVTLLRQSGQKTEAVSFMASLMDQNRNDASNELWLTQLTKLETKVRNIATEVELKLPALDGHRYFIPFDTQKGDFHFIVAEDVESNFLLSEEDAKRLGWTWERISAKRVLIKEASIGSFKLKKFEAEICNSCDSKIGRTFLKYLGAQIDSRGKIPYLVLQGRAL